MKFRSVLFTLFYLLLSYMVNAQDTAVPNQELHFRENKNQWDSRINFIGFINGGCIYLENNTITFKLFDGNDIRKLHPRTEPVVTVHGHIYKMHFVDANPNPVIIKESPSPEYYNYFIGNDSTKWASEVKTFQSITYLNLYPNIDFKVYGMGLTMKYDFIVHAGADVNAIKIWYEGPDGMEIKNSCLHVKTSVGEIIEQPPFSYQNIAWGKIPVHCRYELKNNILQFKIQEKINSNYDLIIDPTLIFSTYTGSTADNFGYTATYDDAGNLYMGGYVNTIQFGGAYPTTAGAFQLAFGGGSNVNGIQYPCDMGITKFNSTGTSLIYSTYLGGNDNETPHSLFVNSANQLCVYGRTYSPDFPVTAGAYDPSYNFDADMTVTVFNITGTALIGSTYVGGDGPDGVNYNPTEGVVGNLKYNYGDDARGEIICDAANNIYVGSCTASVDFPTTPGAFQITWGGNQDGCVFKLNANCSSLIYSTYLGGNQDDACYSIDIKSDNSLYICGGTMSSNFPTIAGGVNTVYMGGAFDGFLCHLNTSGTTLLGSTFLGTTQADQVYNVKLDELEDVYVVGLTEGSFPVSPGVYSNPNSGQFIAKLAPDLSSIIFSTVFGNGNGLPNISPTAFLVDTCGNIYVCGWGTSNFLFIHTTDMTNMPLTPDAFQSTTDGTDFYIIAFSSNAQQLLYGTYFGGNGGIEHVDGGTSRFDKRGIIYEAICAGCGNNSLTPTTPGVWSNTNNSQNCNELGFKMEINLFEVNAVALANPAATGCTPLTVNFENNSTNATLYFWNFGTGNPGDTSIQFQPTFTFTVPGIYNVMLIADNPTSCFGPDTAYTSVVVLNTNVNANFTEIVNDLCDSVIVNFAGTSSGASTQFNWAFGDGTFGNTQNISHVYYNDSSTVLTYTITLIIFDSTACNPGDTVSQTVTVFPTVKSSMGNPDLTGCAPLDCNFFYTGHSQTSVIWNFGDGSNSVLQNPTHTYPNPGTYTVTVIGSNPVACNLADTATCIVTVFAFPPIPDFFADPTTVMLFDPILFTNLTVNGLNYYWAFGDGNTSTEFSPTHSYVDGGDFHVCLMVNTSSPCPDSICKKVTVLLPQAVDVPNAFSPNGDGFNDVLYVKGQGITDFVFKVFNRWGEKVFETNDLKIGWDGIYKTKPQDMDVYVWELNALLEDGKRVVRSGNVSLLR